MTRWKPGSASASPGVSAQPGCIAANATDPRLRATTRASTRPGPASPARTRAARRTSPPGDLEVVERQALRVHAARRDRDHARPRRLAQQRQEPRLERERADDQDRQRRLDAVGALASRRHGSRRRCRPARRGAPRSRGSRSTAAAHRGQRRHVRDDHGKPVGAVAATRASRGARAAPRYARPGSRAPPDRAIARCREAEARGRPGHQRPCARRGPRARGRPTPKSARPDRRPDAAEAADDRDLEQRRRPSPPTCDGPLTGRRIEPCTVAFRH